MDVRCRFRAAASSRANLWTLDGDIDAEEDDEEQAVPWLQVVLLLIGGYRTSKVPKTMDPVLPILSLLGYWAITSGTLGGPGTCKIENLKMHKRSSRARTLGSAM